MEPEKIISSDPRAILERDPVTGVINVRFPDPPPMKPMSKEMAKRIEEKIKSLAKPCECGGEMKFEYFCCGKGNSLTSTEKPEDAIVGKYQCQKCKYRYFITRGQLE